MIKKVVGVVLFLFGIILVLSIVTSVLKMIFIKEKDIIGKDESYVIAYYSGKITLILIFCFINFLCFKYGYRLMRGNKKHLKKKVLILLEKINFDETSRRIHLKSTRILSRNNTEFASNYRKGIARSCFAF